MSCDCSCDYDCFSCGCCESSCCCSFDLSDCCDCCSCDDLCCCCSSCGICSSCCTDLCDCSCDPCDCKEVQRQQQQQTITTTTTTTTTKTHSSNCASIGCCSCDRLANRCCCCSDDAETVVAAGLLGGALDDQTAEDRLIHDRDRNRTRRYVDETFAGDDDDESDEEEEEDVEAMFASAPRAAPLDASHETTMARFASEQFSGNERWVERSAVVAQAQRMGGSERPPWLLIRRLLRGTTEVRWRSPCKRAVAYVGVEVLACTVTPMVIVLHACASIMHNEGMRLMEQCPDVTAVACYRVERRGSTIAPHDADLLADRIPYDDAAEHFSPFRVSEVNYVTAVVMPWAPMEHCSARTVLPALSTAAAASACRKLLHANPLCVRHLHMDAIAFPQASGAPPAGCGVELSDLPLIRNEAALWSGKPVDPKLAKGFAEEFITLTIIQPPLQPHQPDQAAPPTPAPPKPEPLGVPLTASDTSPKEEQALSPPAPLPLGSPAPGSPEPSPRPPQPLGVGPAPAAATVAPAAPKPDVSEVVDAAWASNMAAKDQAELSRVMLGLVNDGVITTAPARFPMLFECCVCGQMVESIGAHIGGCECSSISKTARPHFTCAECTDLRFAAALNDAQVEFDTMACPGAQACDGEWAFDDFGACLTPMSLRKWQRVGMQRARERAAEKAARNTDVLRRQIEEQAHRASRSSRRQADTQRRVEEIMDQVAAALQPKCPHCSLPFASFSGCLTVTCGVENNEGTRVEGCGKIFCGACMTPRPCPGGHSHNFVSDGQLRGMWCTWRSQRVTEILAEHFSPRGPKKKKDKKVLEVVLRLSMADLQAASIWPLAQPWRV